MPKDTRARSRDEREQKLWAEFEKFKAEGRPTGPSAFAKHVGIHRTYLYQFPALVTELSDYGRRTQPRVSKRGRGVPKAEARKKEIDARIRREHTRWSKELPQLRRKVREVEEQLRDRDKRLGELEGQVNVLRRLYEHLLMLSSEAGVSYRELEIMQAKLVKANLLPPLIKNEGEGR